MEEFKILNIDSNDISYNDNDNNLLNPINIKNKFGGINNVIEFYIYDANDKLLSSNYNFKNYQKVNNENNGPLFSNLILNPINDITQLGYSYGNYILTYNFYNNILSSSSSNKFFISEISPSRTEIKLSFLNTSYEDLQKSYIEYVVNKNERSYYSDFILNFGENIKVVGVNISLDTNEDIPSLYIKLYNPLPSNINVKDVLWLSEVLNESFSYTLFKDFEVEETENINKLRGPNFNIKINNQLTSPTPYLNISNVIDSNHTSSFNYVQSLLDNNINININYNEFSNFIHFSSAEERIKNFIYKLKQIELLGNDIYQLSNIPSNATASLGESIINLNKKKDIIIQTFDGYENFLYYESGSKSYPKVSNQKPYINLPSQNSSSLTWLGSVEEESQYLGGILLSASIYDSSNRDYLYNNLPEYIKCDSQNEKIKLFTSLWGHYFDYIWTYIKDISNNLNADNRLEVGISKDLIAETLNSYGINLYNNSRNNDEIYQAILGNDGNGNYLPSTGSYNIDTYITASNYTIPSNDINKELYKRFYHNLPYLLKTKGTNTGLRALINCFGVPETILNPKEFGGNLTTGSFIENENYKFNYKLSPVQNSVVSIPFLPTSQSQTNPDTIEFRFKASSILPTQSIMENGNGSIYIRAINTSGSEAIIDFGIIAANGWSYSSPITIPLYEDNWFNFALCRETGSIINNIDNTYYMYVGYNDNQNNKYIHSSSLFIDGSISSSYNAQWNLKTDISFNDNGQYPFTGSIQEFRYWGKGISVEDFSIHIDNPKSIFFIDESGSYNNLSLRLPLGSELDNDVNNLIYHNLYNGNPYNTPNPPFTILNSPTSIFEYNYEDYYIENPNIGISTEVNNKITTYKEELIPGNTLSPFISIRKPIDRFKNNYESEIGLSPIYSIDDDIIKQLGDFNIGEYIGDPLEYDNIEYEKLNKLKLFYFKKYLRSQDTNDIIKLLSYIDNSLFKIIKDFIPSKSNTSTGLIIKSHILERNKLKRFNPTVSTENLSQSISTFNIIGSSPSDYIGINSTVRNVSYISGTINYIIDDNKEFFDGDFKGSTITAYYPNGGNIIFEQSIINIYNSEDSVFYLNIPLNPIENNITSSRFSKNRYNLDYNSNINEPLNLGIITESLFNNIENNIIQGQIQDSNYSLLRHINPRYNGSKLTAREFNKYNEGDISYGNESVLDLYKTKFAYFEEITSQSLTFPKRSNVYIKYLIDENSNITELSKQNKNIFDVQNIFNVNNVDILLDNNQEPSNQVLLDGINPIFAGGFVYKPILQNFSNDTSTHNSIEFLYENDLQILNVDNIPLIESLPINSIILGDIELNSEAITQPPLNVGANMVKGIINSKLKIPVTRNTTFNGEIRVRISGSFTIKNKVEPLSNLVGTLWDNSDSVSGEFPIPTAGTTNVNILSIENVWGWTPWDNTRFAKIPVGATAYFYNNNNTDVTSILVGNNVKTEINYLFSGGVDYIRVDLNSQNGIISIPQLYSNVGTIPDVSNLTGTYPISGSEGLTTNIEFPIDALIILPNEVQEGDIIIKNSTEVDSLIQTTIVIENTNNTSNLLQYSERPKISNNNIFIQNTPFYYTEPPEYLYVSSSIDYGYNSGSLPDQNWYFERVNSVLTGSFFNRMVASYDFSSILYENGVNNNNIIQLLDESSSIGFDNIEDFFIPKIGDLVRLYNHDRDEFFIPFESEIKNIIYPQLPPSTSSYDNRFIIELTNEIPNQACEDYVISGSAGKNIQNYIFLSKKPNENNIIIFKEKNEGKTSSGIIISNNLDPDIKEKAGNIIKQLKNQNLI